jgi:hypothetical protein
MSLKDLNSRPPSVILVFIALVIPCFTAARMYPRCESLAMLVVVIVIVLCAPWLMFAIDRQSKWLKRKEASMAFPVEMQNETPTCHATKED